MAKSSFPAGWDEERVQRVLAHYETQSEAEAVAEDEAAFETPDQDNSQVPAPLGSAKNNPRSFSARSILAGFAQYFLYLRFGHVVVIDVRLTSARVAVEADTH
jgi:hypothetical protein